MEEVIRTGRLFVPAVPTLWPEMIARRRNVAGFMPFSSPTLRYFYFARNAIWLSVKMLGLEGKEILVPSYHHGVEIEALVDAGAVPRFYRVGSGWDVDVEDVRRRIGPRTGALYLTHYAGFPGPWAAMRRLADRNHLVLMEDCALSLLSCDGTVPLGITGDVAFFCLYKTLPVPNGGAMVINGDKPYSVPEPPPPPKGSTLTHLASSLLQNLELRGGAAGRAVRATFRGLSRRSNAVERIGVVATGTQHFDRAHVDLGMSPLTRRIVEAQDLPAIVEKRRRNYFLLLGKLREVAPPLLPQLPAGVCPLFYPLCVKDKDAVLSSLWAAGIDCIDFWRHSHPACDPAEFPEAAGLRRTVIEIPCHQDLSPELLSEMAGRIRAAVRASQR